MRYKLTDNDIYHALSDIEKDFKTRGFIQTDIANRLLMVEEILISYKTRFGSEVEFDIVLRRSAGLYNILIKVECEKYNYSDSVDEGDILGKLENTVGIRAVWTYRNGYNKISIVIRKEKKIPQLVWIVVGIGLAYCLHLLCGIIPNGAADLIETVISDKLTPAVYSILRMIAGALIFFSVSTSISAMGNLQTFKRLIGTTLGRISLNYILMILVFTFGFCAVTGVQSGKSTFDIHSITDLIFDMIPSDLLTPFIEGNMFQITILAIVIGILMIALENNTTTVTDLFECFRQFSIIAMQAFCEILPFVVFLNVFIVFSTLNGSSVSVVLVDIVVGVLIALILIIASGLKACIISRINILSFFKNSMKGTVVGLVTASSSAALPDTKKDLIRIGVHEEFINLMLPLQQAFYKPFALLIIYTGVFSVVQAFDIPLNIGAVINLALIAFIIANACPPVPGGIISCLTILDAQMMFPDGAMGILILIATLMDYFGGGLSMFSIHAEITELAHKMGRLNNIDNIDID